MANGETPDGIWERKTGLEPLCDLQACKHHAYSQRIREKRCPGQRPFVGFSSCESQTVNHKGAVGASEAYEPVGAFESALMRLLEQGGIIVIQDIQ